MFSTIRNFLNRHKRKFLVTSLLFGGLYLASNYAQRKLREWQERETRKFIDMTRKKQHFESTERTCNQTIISLSKVIGDNILKLLDTDEILRRLQENPENKFDLWAQMKVMIFTRVCLLVYSFCILVVMLRVQLNIIGGYLYKDSVTTDGRRPLITSDIQTKYLSLCHNFISSGIEQLSEQIKAKVKIIVEPISLKEKMTINDIEQLFWRIQTALCTDPNDPVKLISPYLMGGIVIPETDEVFTNIIKETADILESDEVVSLTMTSISRCFSKIIDDIALLYNPAPTSKKQLEINGNVNVNGRNGFVSINEIELHLVKVITIMNDMIKGLSDRNLQDSLLELIMLNDKQKLLGANIYEVFSSD